MPVPAASGRPDRLGPAEWALLAEALATLAAASLGIAILRFRTVAAWASRGRPRSGTAGGEVARVRWAVEAWARRVPWRAVCFQKGLAAHLMLRRREIPSTLVYGVAQRPAEGLGAHVWVEVAGEAVVGGEEAPRFAPLARFPASG